MSSIEEINEGVLIAYLNKELSNEDMIKVDLWLAKSSANVELFNEVRETWQLTGRLKTKPANVDTDRAWGKVMDQINNPQKGQVVQMKPKKRVGFVAAAAVLMALIGSLVVFMINDSNEIGSGMLDLTAGNSVVSERLPDGSDVTLNENSVLSYPPQFEGSERRVKLTGECFFDIERNEEKPFIIDLPDQGSYVKVLGTSFNIQAVEGGDFSEVYVSTGKVEFGSDVDKEILLAGEKAIMNNATGEIEKINDEILDKAETFWMNNTLDFQGESMDEVVKTLNAVYDDEVVIECQGLELEPVNSTHEDESLEAILITLSTMQNFDFYPEETESGKVYRLICK